MTDFIQKVDIVADHVTSASSLLSAQSGLSKNRIKDAMIKGAVWLEKATGRAKRLRRATASLKPGDQITLYYNKALLDIKPPAAECISDQQHYSIWYKPAGLLSQGTRYGDHCSLLRQAELFFNPNRHAYLIHRLDRETSGLMIIAHSKEAATKFSTLFQTNKIFKQYSLQVLGDLQNSHPQNPIKLPLDGKPAITEFICRGYNQDNNSSSAIAIIKTGRTHQIRRHFQMIGFPILGDPRYGKGNKNSDGMKLQASTLRFTCPFSFQDMEFNLQ